MRISLLLDPVYPQWRYCLLLVPIALVPSACLFLAASHAFGLAGADTTSMSPPALVLSAGEFFGVVVFAPVVETYVLAGFIGLLARAKFGPLSMVLMSALLWGCLHAVFGLLWFFGTVWTFAALSSAYIAWRRVSFRRAYVAAFVPHVLINLSVFALVLAGI